MGQTLTGVGSCSAAGFIADVCDGKSMGKELSRACFGLQLASNARPDLRFGPDIRSISLRGDRASICSRNSCGRFFLSLRCCIDRIALREFNVVPTPDRCCSLFSLFLLLRDDGKVNSAVFAAITVVGLRLMRSVATGRPAQSGLSGNRTLTYAAQGAGFVSIWQQPESHTELQQSVAADRDHGLADCGWFR